MEARERSENPKAENKGLEDKQLLLQVREGSRAHCSPIIPEDAFGTKMSLHLVPCKMNQNLQGSFVSWLHNLPQSLDKYLLTLCGTGKMPATGHPRQGCSDVVPALTGYAECLEPGVRISHTGDVLLDRAGSQTQTSG